jgi:membrane protease YdiL (CAAX protease family)
MESERLQTWLAVVPAMLVPALGAYGYFVFYREADTARLAYGATKVFTLLWPVLAVLLVQRERWPAWPPAWINARALPLGLISGLGIAVGMLGLMRTPLWEVLSAGQASIRLKSESFGFLRYYWLFGLLLSLFHSLLEEYYWRWFVFGRLRRVLPLAAAHGLAGAAFAAHHIVIASVYFGPVWGVALGTLVGGGGVIWSVLYVKQRTLVGAWVSHIFVDLGLMLIGHRLLFGAYV